MHWGAGHPQADGDMGQWGAGHPQSDGDTVQWGAGHPQSEGDMVQWGALLNDRHAASAESQSEGRETHAPQEAPYGCGETLLK